MIGDLLAGAGLVLAGAAACVAIVVPASRLRSGAMLAAIVLAPALILGNQWDSSRIADLRDHPSHLVALAVIGIAAVAALVVLFRRHPRLMPLALIVAIPFRVPLHSGGDQANLLLPLYLVIAAAVLVTALRDASAAAPEPAPPGRSTAALRWLPRLLALLVGLYALQTLYSEDLSQGLQNLCFFLVPFSLLFTLLRDARWDRRALRDALVVVVAESVVFAVVGFGEYASRHLLWNSAVIRSNDFHVYFRVNSLFWDPNVYGRYLSLVITLLAAALLWARSRRTALLLAAAAAILWLGLVSTFSQSSFAALGAGLVTLAALRWSLRWTLIASAAGAVAMAIFLAAAGGSLKIDFSRLNIDTSGRANLVSGGVSLFGERPVWGYGAGSFSKAFRANESGHRGPLSVSHTEPITIAAEQGLVGLAAYVALLVAALIGLCTGLRDLMPGLGRAPPGAAGSTALAAARAGIFAAFIALLVHTMAYAGFLEDPSTWVLLSIGAALAALRPGDDEAAQGAAAAATADA